MKRSAQTIVGFHLPTVPTIQTIKGRGSIFSAAGATQKKSLPLKPLTVWIFAVPFRRRKRGTGINPIPRFRSLHYTAKPSPLLRDCPKFCGGSAPAPPASSKEQERA